MLYPFSTCSEYQGLMQSVHNSEWMNELTRKQATVKFSFTYAAFIRERELSAEFLTAWMLKLLHVDSHRLSKC